MGKRTRKTRWRTLEIGDSDSEESSTLQTSHSSKHFPNRPFYSKYTFSSQSTPTRRFTTYDAKSTRSSSTASDTKITFNEDEYTKITTPRQDVLFKKGYLNKPKIYQTQTSTGNSTGSTGNSTGNGTPDHQSADGTESTDVEYESQFVFPNAFVDHNGIYYINSFEPYPLVMYNPQLCYPEYQMSRSKRLSTGSLTESTSPNNEETSQDLSQSGGETSGAVPEYNHVYMYQGYYYNNPCSSNAIENGSTTEPRKVKKKRRRRVSKTVPDGSTTSEDYDSSEEPVSQIENKVETGENPCEERLENVQSDAQNEETKDEETKAEPEEDKETEHPTKTDEEEIVKTEIEKEDDEEAKKETKFNLNAQEFIPRAFRGSESTQIDPNIQFVNVHPNFIPLPFVNHPLTEIGAQGFPPAFLPPGIPLGFVPHDPKLVPNFINFVPNQFYAKPFENVPTKKDGQIREEPETAITEEKPQQEVVEEKPKVHHQNQVDIAKIVSKLEEAAKEQRQSETTSKRNFRSLKYHKMQRRTNFQSEHGGFRNNFDRRRNFEKRRNERCLEESMEKSHNVDTKETTSIRAEEERVTPKTENHPIDTHPAKPIEERVNSPRHNFRSPSHSTPKRLNNYYKNNHSPKARSFQEFSSQYPSQHFSSRELSSPLNYSETLKRSTVAHQNYSPKHETTADKTVPLQIKAKDRSEESKTPKSPNQWISVSNRKKRKNKSINEEETQPLIEEVDENLSVETDVLVLTKEEERMINEDNKKLKEEFQQQPEQIENTKQNEEIPISSIPEQNIIEMIRESTPIKIIPKEVMQDIQEIEKELMKESILEVPVEVPKEDIKKPKENKKKLKKPQQKTSTKRILIKDLDFSNEEKTESSKPAPILNKEHQKLDNLVKNDDEPQENTKLETIENSKKHETTYGDQKPLVDKEIVSKIEENNKTEGINSEIVQDNSKLPANDSEESICKVDENVCKVEENVCKIEDGDSKVENVCKSEEVPAKIEETTPLAIKKKPKKKKKISNPTITAINQSQSSSSTTLNTLDESYDFLLDTSVLVDDKTNVEVSEELDKMIQKGLFGNLEEKIKSLNVSIDDDFFKSLNFAPKQSTPDKGFIKAADLTSILKNNNQFLQKNKPENMKIDVDFSKIKLPEQPSTSKDYAFLDLPQVKEDDDKGMKKGKNKNGKLKNKSKKNQVEAAKIQNFKETISSEVEGLENKNEDSLSQRDKETYGKKQDDVTKSDFLEAKDDLKAADDVCRNVDTKKSIPIEEEYIKDGEEENFGCHPKIYKKEKNQSETTGEIPKNEIPNIIKETAFSNHAKNNAENNLQSDDISIETNDVLQVEQINIENPKAKNTEDNLQDFSSDNKENSLTIERQSMDNDEIKKIEEDTGANFLQDIAMKNRDEQRQETENEEDKASFREVPLNLQEADGNITTSVDNEEISLDVKHNSLETRPNTKPISLLHQENDGDLEEEPIKVMEISSPIEEISGKIEEISTEIETKSLKTEQISLIKDTCLSTNEVSLSTTETFPNFEETHLNIVESPTNIEEINLDHTKNYTKTHVDNKDSIQTERFGDCKIDLQKNSSRNEEIDFSETQNTNNIENGDAEDFVTTEKLHTKNEHVQNDIDTKHSCDVMSEEKETSERNIIEKNYDKLEEENLKHDKSNISQDESSKTPQSSFVRVLKSVEETEKTYFRNENAVDKTLNMNDNYLEREETVENDDLPVNEIEEKLCTDKNNLQIEDVNENNGDAISPLSNDFETQGKEIKDSLNDQDRNCPRDLNKIEENCGGNELNLPEICKENLQIYKDNLQSKDNGDFKIESNEDEKHNNGGKNGDYENKDIDGTDLGLEESEGQTHVLQNDFEHFNETVLNFDLKLDESEKEKSISLVTNDDVLHLKEGDGFEEINSKELNLQNCTIKADNPDRKMDNNEENHHKNNDVLHLNNGEEFEGKTPNGLNLENFSAKANKSDRTMSINIEESLNENHNLHLQNGNVFEEKNSKRLNLENSKVKANISDIKISTNNEEDEDNDVPHLKNCVVHEEINSKSSNNQNSSYKLSQSDLKTGIDNDENLTLFVKNNDDPHLKNGGEFENIKPEGLNLQNSGFKIDIKMAINNEESIKVFDKSEDVLHLRNKDFEDLNKKELKLQNSNYKLEETDLKMEINKEEDLKLFNISNDVLHLTSRVLEEITSKELDHQSSLFNDKDINLKVSLCSEETFKLFNVNNEVPHLKNGHMFEELTSKPQNLVFNADNSDSKIEIGNGENFKLYNKNDILHLKNGDISEEIKLERSISENSNFKIEPDFKLAISNEEKLELLDGNNDVLRLKNGDVFKEILRSQNSTFKADNSDVMADIRSDENLKSFNNDVVHLKNFVAFEGLNLKKIDDANKNCSMNNIEVPHSQSTCHQIGEKDEMKTNDVDFLMEGYTVVNNLDNNDTIKERNGNFYESQEKICVKTFEKFEIHVSTEDNSKNPQKSITQAVREWMVKTREKTPEIEILKSPDTINREFSNLRGLEEEEEDILEEGEEVTVFENVDQKISKTNDQIEEAEDVLEVYESKYGKNEDFLKLQEEMEEIKRRRTSKHGDLPYRAICCSLM